MHRTQIPSLRWEERRSPSGKFHSFARNVSLALGGQRDVGTWGGGHPFDVQVRRIPPGAIVCPFHLHFAQWELFVVERGTGTLRVGAETRAVRAGDVFIHPPGEAHQLRNTGAGDLFVTIIADNPLIDVYHYPDSDKWGMRPPYRFFRIADVDYFDGEENSPPGAPGYRPPAPAPTPSITPFAERFVHIDALAWEPWASPKGRFRGASKELSIALGAKRNAPTGLGGHPFDLELARLAPGECYAPFHAHAAQWELFILLSGAGTVRTPEGTTPAGAGDALLHAPGEAHQLTNTGDADLLYYCAADNPPVDYWRYPDSDKWGFREPRKIFRATDADYFDGEE